MKFRPHPPRPLRPERQLSHRKAPLSSYSWLTRRSYRSWPAMTDRSIYLLSHPEHEHSAQDAHVDRDAAVRGLLDIMRRFLTQ